jgi:hypothetical protein
VFAGPRLLNLVRRVVSGSMYSTRRLHDLIATELGDAREWMLNDAPVDVLITSRRRSTITRPFLVLELVLT